MVRESKLKRLLETAHVGLRIIAIGFASASVVTMVTSDQEIYMMDYIAIAKAHYTYSSALRFKLIADAVICAYSLLSSIVVYRNTKGSHTQPKTSFYFCLLIADVVMMTLMVSGCAAATGVGLVALKGIEQPGISWAPICHLAGNFCMMVALSIAFSYSAFACFTTLAFLSAFNLKLLA